MAIASHQSGMAPEPEKAADKSVLPVISNGNHAPPSHWNQISAPAHFVQFYEKDEFLLNSLGGFIEAGLSTGDPCIVIATREHRVQLEQRLHAHGLELAAAQVRGEYIALDASEMLSKLMVDGLPEPKRFIEIFGGLIARAAQEQRRVRVFGEMVALLWLAGNQAGAVRLEALWNELAESTSPFSLFCAYPMPDFAGEGYQATFAAICQQHSHVLPDESYAALDSPEERLRAITLLQQKANSLQAEIAERKAVEERLRISENRYRRLFEASTDGILMVDPGTGTIIDANPALMKLLDNSPYEQVLGRELWQIGLFQDRQANLEALRTLQEQHMLRYELLPLRAKDGQRRYVEFVSTQYQANGHDVIQCNLRDITDRRELEQRTFEALTALLELARSLAWMQHEAKPPTMRTVAPQLAELARRVLGCERVTLTLYDQATGAQEVVATAGTPTGHLLQWPLLDGNHSQDTLTPEAIATLQTGTSLVVDVTPHKLRAASARGIKALMSPMQIAEHLVGFLSYDYGTAAHTFTAQERHLAEAAAQLAAFVLEREHWLDERTTTQAKLLTLEETTRQMDHFLGIVTHELRTPITALKTQIQLVLRRIGQEPASSTEAQRSLTPTELLARTDGQLRRLTRLIDDLVDLSRIRADKLEMRLDYCNLSQIVAEIVENERLVHPDRLIRLEAAEQPLVVYGDPDRLGQVALNYLTNALKYSTSDRPVTVRVYSDKARAHVSVQDKGPGIPPEEQPHIWELFHRAPGIQVLSGSGIGLGLGLHISKTMIERQGGQVGVESLPGQGSTFWFMLPLAGEK
ncbi:MAG TPA: ATP-binding protein [Ktedonobacterales bacterium]|nr:ATP-binding protein [Ktedonobacterales bacterium]